jgi:hypothetical protein
MTQYTIGKDGKVTSKGTGKKPITTRYMKGDIPATIPWGIKKIKKMIKGSGKAKAAEGVVKSRKSPGPTQRKKLSKVSGKAKATAKRAAIREKARNPNKKKY